MPLSKRLLFNYLLSCIILSGSAINSWGTIASNDPTNDTFGVPSVAHDITRLDRQAAGEYMLVLMEFHETIAAPSDFSPKSVVGYIDIDADRNPSTGGPSNLSRFAPGGDAGLGIEYYVDLFSERFHPGLVEVIDPFTVEAVGMATAVYGPSNFRIEVPLHLIGGDANVNVGAIVGDFLDMSDTALTLVPEPAGLAPLICGIAFVASLRRRPRS